MERLGDNAKRVLSAAGVPDLGLLPSVVAAWPTIVGVAISRAAWPQRLTRDGTLHVTTASATWAFELSRLSPEILARLREGLGADAPAALRFVAGPVPAPGGESAEPLSPPPPITRADRDSGARLAAAIGDQELRELVARAASASLARARSDRRFC
jgi:hypothetical protein